MLRKLKDRLAKHVKRVTACRLEERHHLPSWGENFVDRYADEKTVARYLHRETECFWVDLDGQPLSCNGWPRPGNTVKLRSHYAKGDGKCRTTLIPVESLLEDHPNISEDGPKSSDDNL